MKQKEEPSERHKELSLMFLKMGKALVDEGFKNNDYVTASVGNNMIFMSSIIFSKNETRLFGELCSMISAKRLISGISTGEIDISKLENLKNGKTDDPFEQIKRRINRDFGDDKDKPEE